MKSHCTLARVVILLFLLVASISAQAVIPPSLNYQGHLTDDSSIPVDGLVNVTFNIYNVEIGGTPLWTDSQLVDVQQGIFSAELGNATNPLPINLFETPVYIGIAVESDGEMIPRRPLTSTAYSFKSQDSNTLDGSTASSLDQSAHVADIGNPHGITASQVGAVSDAELGLHAADSSAHHVRYSNTEAVTAMGAKNDANPLHHNKFTDSNAYKAILTQDGSGSLVDADLLDGLDSSAFMPLGTDLWVNSNGDTMNGTLLISGANRLGIGVASASYPLHVNGEVKLGNKVRLGSAEYFEDGGTNTISTGPNSLQVGGILSSTGVLEADGGVRFADGTTQNTAAASVENRFVVAKSGGDYPTIQAAINASTPTDTDPVIIEVAPGVYTESVVMKSYIHLRGSGPEQTTIIPDSAGGTTDQAFTAIWMDNLEDVEVDGFTLYGGEPGVETIGAIGIRDIASSPVIENMRITGFIATAPLGVIYKAGVYSTNSSPRILNSEINLNERYGILLQQAFDAKVIGNSFKDNTGDSPERCALSMIGSEVIATNNHFSGNGAPVCASFDQASATISKITASSNRLTGNFDGIRLDGDVYAEIIGNHIDTIPGFGTGIYGSEVPGGTRIIGNTVLGGQNGIYAPTRATIIGNHVVPGCSGGGCPSIWYVDQRSEVVGNFAATGYGPGNEGLNLETSGFTVNSVDPQFPSAPGEPITFTIGNTTIQFDEDGDVTITAGRDIIMTANRNITIDAGNDLTVRANNLADIDVSTSLNIDAGTTANIRSTGELDLTSGTTVDINGPTITLN